MDVVMNVDNANQGAPKISNPRLLSRYKGELIYELCTEIDRNTHSAQLW